MIQPLGYIYSKRVWTKFLEALAMASLGAQLAELHVPNSGGLGSGSLGVIATPYSILQRLWKMDGLIDPRIVHRNTGPLAVEDHEMTALPPPYAPRGYRPALNEGFRRQKVNWEQVR